MLSNRNDAAARRDHETVQSRQATYTTTSQPATEPVTLDQLKDALRILVPEFDAELLRILKTARAAVEEDTRRRFITQTVALYLDYWTPGDTLELRIAPVSAVTSIQYVDEDGVTQTFSSSSYQTDFDHTPPRIMLVESEQWPTDIADQVPKAVTVTLTAGYGDPDDVPHEARLAIIEYARWLWHGCEGDIGPGSKYDRLKSLISWTNYHRVQ